MPSKRGELAAKLEEEKRNEAMRRKRYLDDVLMEASKGVLEIDMVMYRAEHDALLRRVRSMTTTAVKPCSCVGGDHSTDKATICNMAPHADCVGCPLHADGSHECITSAYRINGLILEALVGELTPLELLAIGSRMKEVLGCLWQMVVNVRVLVEKGDLGSLELAKVIYHRLGSQKTKFVDRYTKKLCEKPILERVYNSTSIRMSLIVDLSSGEQRARKTLFERYLSEFITIKTNAYDDHKKREPEHMAWLARRAQADAVARAISMAEERAEQARLEKAKKTRSRARNKPKLATEQPEPEAEQPEPVTEQPKPKIKPAPAPAPDPKPAPDPVRASIACLYKGMPSYSGVIYPDGDPTNRVDSGYTAQTSQLVGALMVSAALGLLRLNGIEPHCSLILSKLGPTIPSATRTAVESYISGHPPYLFKDEAYAALQLLTCAAIPSNCSVSECQQPWTITVGGLGFCSGHSMIGAIFHARHCLDNGGCHFSTASANGREISWSRVLMAATVNDGTSHNHHAPIDSSVYQEAFSLLGFDGVRIGSRDIAFSPSSAPHINRPIGGLEAVVAPVAGISSTDNFATSLTSINNNNYQGGVIPLQLVQHMLRDKKPIMRGWQPPP